MGMVLAIVIAVAWTTPGSGEDVDQALLAAAEQGRLKAVEDLLGSGAVVDTRRKNEGSTALMLACGKGYTDVAKILLDKGADPNARNMNGWTSLMGAAANGHEGATKLLLDRGANVNFKHSYGYTALKLAKHKKHKKIVELLIKRGASQ